MFSTALACAWLLVSSAGAPQPQTYDTIRPSVETVYKNTIFPKGNAIEDILPTTKIGNQVTLEGDARLVTRMVFRLGGQDLSTEGNTTTVEYKVRLMLYDPNQPHRPNAPGRLIWTTLRQKVKVEEGRSTLVTFRLPRVEVPDEIVWALAFSDFEQYVIAPSIPFYGPPTIGSAREDGYWYYNVLGRVWLVQDIGGTAHFARIDAVVAADEDEDEDGEDGPRVGSRR